MKKGQKKRIWTKEQKIEIIEKHLKEHVSVRTIEKEYKDCIHYRTRKSDFG